MSANKEILVPGISEPGRDLIVGADSGSRPDMTGGNNEVEKVKEKEGKREGKNIRKPGVGLSRPALQT